MKQTKLRINYLKNRCNTNRNAYDAQTNICFAIVRITKLDYHNKLNYKKSSYNNTFWKTVKPFCTDKAVNQERILLVEVNETILDNDKVSEKFNNFFSDVVKHLHIPQNE